MIGLHSFEFDLGRHLAGVFRLLILRIVSYIYGGLLFCGTLLVVEILRAGLLDKFIGCSLFRIYWCQCSTVKLWSGKQLIRDIIDVL